MEKNKKKTLVPEIAIKNTTDTLAFEAIPENFLIYNIQEKEDISEGYYYWSKNQWNPLDSEDVHNIIQANAETTNIDSESQDDASVQHPALRNSVYNPAIGASKPPLSRASGNTNLSSFSGLASPPFVANINGQNWTPNPPRWYVETDKKIKISGNGSKEEPHIIGIAPKSIKISDIEPLYSNQNRNIYSLVSYRGKVQWQYVGCTPTNVYTLD